MNDPVASRRFLLSLPTAHDPRSRIPRFLASALAGLLTMLGGEASLASPHVQVRTDETQVVYGSHGRCGHDIPDRPARAIRSADGLLQLIVGNSQLNFRLTGSSFDDLRRDCTPIIESGRDPDPAAYDDAEWLVSPYVVPDGRIAALIHNEYHPWEHPQQGVGCEAAVDLDEKSSRQEERSAIRHCWYNAITFASSTDNGASYTSPPSPANFVAGVPYPYEPDMGKTGLFSPSDIVLNPADGYYYFLAFGQIRLSGARVCALRTRDLFDPASWRAWNGHDFSMTMVDPYATNVDDPAKHECAPLRQARPNGKAGHLTATVRGLTYSTFYKKWMIVYSDASKRAPEGSGLYFALSDDLLDWSRPYLIMTVPAGDDRRTSIVYPSIIDHSDDSANFQNTGQHAWLYYVKFDAAADEARFGKYATPPGKARVMFRVPIDFMPLEE